LKLICGPFHGVRNFFIVELDSHINNWKNLPLQKEEKK
jgi:hypothetical protein